MIRTELRQMNGFTEMKMCDFTTAEVFTQIVSAATDCGADGLDDLVFRRTNFPPDELSAGRDDDYIWLDLWTDLAVCA